ncbi:MAG: hypothetical protein ACRYFS_24050 [Janthinobacterium lividum]
MKPLLKSIASALFLLSAGGLAAGRLAAAPTPRYEVIPLRSLPGTETEDTAYCNPCALNNKGECAGSAGVHERFQAVRWDADGSIHLLSTPVHRLFEAEGINDQGQVIADAIPSKTFPGPRLYVVNKMGRVRLLKPPVGTQTLDIGGEAINNAGQTAFNVVTEAGFPFCAVLNTHGATKDLGHLLLRPATPQLKALMTHTQIHALNNSGMAVGDRDTYVKGMNTVPAHAFIWRKGVMMDLGTLPGYDASSATALNDRGDVIGMMTHLAEMQFGPTVCLTAPHSGPNPAFHVHGFLWRNGVMTNLGALPGCRYTEPTSINDEGQIVGNSYNIVQEDGDLTLSGGALGSGVFLWQNGKMTDLQTLVPSGWKLESAVAINNRGDILCTGHHNGMPSPALGSSAFLLRRVTPALSQK